MAERNSRMKPVPANAAARRKTYAAVAAVAAAVVGGALWGLSCGYDAMMSAYDEQCRVIDADVDVVVVVTGSAKMVHRDLVTDFFGLTNGANLAEIDFAGKRAELLHTPNIRDVRIERRMPNRVTIEVFEREPVARVAGQSRRAWATSASSRSTPPPATTSSSPSATTRAPSSPGPTWARTTPSPRSRSRTR